MDLSEAARVVAAALAVRSPDPGLGPSPLAAAAESLHAVAAEVLGDDEVVDVLLRRLHAAAGRRREADAWRELLRVRLLAVPDAELRQLVPLARRVLALVEPEVTAAVTDGGAAPVAATARTVVGAEAAGPATGDPVRELVPSPGRPSAPPAAGPTATPGSQPARPAAGPTATPGSQPASPAAGPAGSAARAARARGHRSPSRAAAIARVLQQRLDDAERRLGPDHPDTVAARAALRDWRGA